MFLNSNLFRFFSIHSAHAQGRDRNSFLNLAFRTALAVGLFFFAGAQLNRVHAQAVMVNVNAEDGAPLSAAIQAKGLTVNTLTPADDLDSGTKLIVWEAIWGHADITPERAKQISEIVRQGGSLLLTFSSSTGVGPMRLASILPTIPWHASTGEASRGGPRPQVSTLSWDTTLFPNKEPAGLSLPFHYDIEPMTAVERGMARYDPFYYDNERFDIKHAPGEFYWTRPLLNREWTTRIRGNDGPETPLLITGRYGAGRVAVFASSIRSVTGDNQKIWADLVNWLATPPPAAAPSAPLGLEIASTPSIDVSGTKTLAVTVSNSAAAAVSGTVLVRFLSWQETMVGDAQKEFTVGPQAKTTVLLPFPAPGPTGYQDLDFRNAFDVRVGLLSADQQSLLAETHQQVDLDPPLVLSVMTDNLRTFTYPFPAPSQDENAGLRNRMGTPVGAYAYKPGQTVSATVTLANGVRNLAPLAKVEDERQPDNPTAPALTQNASQSEKASRDGFGGSGAWIGQVGNENVLKFTFPQPVWLNAVVLNGDSIEHRGFLLHNPGAVSVEFDGKEVAKDESLDDKFVAGLGLVRIEVPPAQVQTVRIHLPWIFDGPGGKRRLEPWLGGVILEGSTSAFPPEQKGTVSLTLSDSLTGTETPIGQKDVTVAPGATQVVPFSFALPGGSGPSFYRLKATFQGQEKVVPVLAINPTQTMLPASLIHPEGEMGMVFTVTGGFRGAAPIGINTQEVLGAWESPDDMVWALCHGLKQTSTRYAPRGDMLFSINADLAHYCNPWTCFRNGEMFFTKVAPFFLETLKHRRDYDTNEHVAFGFSDRWDSGPSMNSMYTWQDLVAFDQYLRSQGKPGLKGQTHEELCVEVDTQFNGLWQNWQISRYVQNVETLRKTFEGKTVVISGQGIPLMPAASGKIVAQTVRGMSDDNTWGMWSEDIALTTGKQLVFMAYDPWWALVSNYVWGWNSSILNNRYWFAAVGTTEPSRRHYSDRAWRATIDGDGHYRSMFTYGYGANGGTSYAMNQNDWQQDWLMQERHSLFYPEGPIGAGLILGTSSMDDPSTAMFSGGGMGGSPAEHIVDGIAPLFAKLEHAGVSLPFMASASSISQWKGSAPLIVANLSVLNDAEVEILKKRIAAGTPVAAIQGPGPISPAGAALFGVHVDGTPDSGKVVGQINQEPTTTKVPVIAQGLTLFIPGDGTTFTNDDMQVLAPLLVSHLNMPIQFPEGTNGYGFTDAGLSYIVVEDWLDQGRSVALRVRAGSGKSAHAIDVNDHQPLTVHRDQNDWVIDVPLRPGDGVLVALSESP